MRANLSFVNSAPSSHPTSIPTESPSIYPSRDPSKSPIYTSDPSKQPSQDPTESSTHNPVRSDPFCEDGILDDKNKQFSNQACCLAICGECGGGTCWTRPGGNTGCCGTWIQATNISCDHNVAPCVVSWTRQPTQCMYLTIVCVLISYKNEF